LSLARRHSARRAPGSPPRNRAQPRYEYTIRSRSNVSVGPPIDLLVYRRDSLAPGFAKRLEGGDPYLVSIRDAWGSAIHKAFQENIPDPDWKF